MYFSKFPLYATSTIAGYDIVIQDIFKRVIMTSGFGSFASVLTPYAIRDGETPEQVAQRFYGNPQYHWIVIYANNIINVRNEWPLENRFVLPLIYDTYDFILNFTSLPPDVIEGGTLRTSEDGTLRILSVDDNVIRARATGGPTHIATDTQITYIHPITKVRTKNLRAFSITDPEEGIHHYTDVTNGFVVDADTSNPNIVAVSNAEYEYDRNDKKRYIRVLDPRYLGQFMTTFNSLMNG